MAYIIVAITSGTSWTVPSDYGTPSTVDCIGGGEGGVANAQGGGGGGGGAFARLNNMALTPGSSVPIQIGGYPSGSHVKDTWFMSATTVLAKGAVGQNGGVSSQCIGSLVNGGGNA